MLYRRLAAAACGSVAGPKTNAEADNDQVPMSSTSRDVRLVERAYW